MHFNGDVSKMPWGVIYEDPGLGFVLEEGS